MLSTSSEKGYSTTDLIYYLEVDNGRGGEFRPLYSSSTQNFFDLLSITPGSVLWFRLYVENNMGYSSYSQILEVLFAEVPSAPAAPYFIDWSGDDFDGKTPFIQVGWKPPVDNGGSVILGYKVYV